MARNWHELRPWHVGQFHKWLPVIDEELCTGCGLCVKACRPDCLGIVDGVAMLLSAESCGSEEHCVAACAEDAIHMQWIPMRGDGSVGRWQILDGRLRS
jgi:MinD superfamily P-loop ATPase